MSEPDPGVGPARPEQPDSTGSPDPPGEQSRGSAGIVDVARLAGVSVATVSRALRGMANVSETTRRRVLQAAAELEYAASPLASGLATGRIRSVGVVTPYAGRWFFAEAIHGIERALREHGYDLVLHVVTDPVSRSRFFTELPVRRRVDGVAVVALPLAPAERQLLIGLGVPLASVAEPVEGMHGERIDNVAAARLAVEHLIALGHRRIAMIGGPAQKDALFRVPRLRAQGFAEAMAVAGLPARPAWTVDGSYTAAGGERAMASLLADPGERPTAVFCQSDEMAFGALRAARQAGVRCPEQLSIVGIDDHELAHTFDVTTVAQPVAHQGAAAARWLVERLAGTRVDDQKVHEHPVELVVRGSTARLTPG